MGSESKKGEIVFPKFFPSCLLLNLWLDKGGGEKTESMRPNVATDEPRPEIDPVTVPDSFACELCYGMSV